MWTVASSRRLASHAVLALDTSTIAPVAHRCPTVPQLSWEGNRLSAAETTQFLLRFKASKIQQTSRICGRRGLVFASQPTQARRYGQHGAKGDKVGVVLFSGAIIISLLAMRARAPQWLLMFCGAWTLFTLLNVSWQPLMAFQLALIWGGYAFLAPRDLSQHKFWKSRWWQSIRREGMVLKRPTYLEHGSAPSLTAAYDHVRSAEGDYSSLTESRPHRPLNKSLIADIFIVISILNLIIHLYPFNYNNTLMADEIARSLGVTVAIFLFSLIGLTFRPSKTFGMSAIAILIAPVAILADRAHDPIAPPYFRELLHSKSGLAIGTAQPGAIGNGEPTDNLAPIMDDVENSASHNIAGPAGGQAIQDLGSGKRTPISSQDTIPTSREFIKTVDRAVDKFSTILANDGMLGAQKYSSICRSAAMKSAHIIDTDYCTAFDMAALSADVGISETSGFPRNEYFISRAKIIDMEYKRFSQSTDGRTELIWKEVNSVLLASFQSAHGGSE